MNMNIVMTTAAAGMTITMITTMTTTMTMNTAATAAIRITAI